MRNQRLSIASLLVTLVVSLASMSLHAEPRSPRHAQPHMLLAQTETISSDKAAAIAKQATGGRVLSVKRTGNSYQVKVLLRGERVRTVRVDARTGKLKK